MIEIQYAHTQNSSPKNCPDETHIQQWAQLALLPENADKEVVIRFVSASESQQLNKQFRNKDKPTNILSFPFQEIPGVEIPHLGDLVICVDVIVEEAKNQDKSIDAHYAHMIIHGLLHLQGHDHENPDDANVMEKLEIELLEQIGLINPY